MKFFIIFSLVSLLLGNFVLGIKIKKVEPVSDEQAAANKQVTESFNKELQKLWEVIFKENDRKECSPASKNATLTPADGKVIDGIETNKPLPRKNIYAKLELGFGRSAYLFDYLDEMLLKDFVEAFAKIAESVKKNPQTDPVYEDPYTMVKMLSLPADHGLTDLELSSKMKQASPAFDEDFWKNSFNAVQINKAIRDNKWNVELGVSNPAKRMIDRFDFNGDGRLTVSELIIAVIDANKGILGENKCLNCLEEIVQDKLDPIYMFSDCDNDGKLSAEEMWKAFKYLKRGSDNYNIYNCLKAGVEARTGAVNDFILKCQNSLNGTVTKREFAICIIVGYWNRQTDQGSIFKVDNKSRRVDRWRDPAGVDNSCQ